MCSSARLALLSSTVRGPAPYSTAGMPCSQYSRASVYSGVPEAWIGSPNTVAGMLAQRVDQRLVARQGLQRVGQQQPLDVHA